MLTSSQFAAWLQSRRDSGDSYAAIGHSLGVSHEAVRGWMVGRIRPSETVLLLAARIARDSAADWPLIGG